jgi:hypothetical protein
MASLFGYVGSDARVSIAVQQQASARCDPHDVQVQGYVPVRKLAECQIPCLIAYRLYSEEWIRLKIAFVLLLSLP